MLNEHLRMTDERWEVMTHDEKAAFFKEWHALPVEEQQRLRSTAGLHPKLRGLEGKVIDVFLEGGKKKRFKLGISTGWRPTHLWLRGWNAHGGHSIPPQEPIVSVAVVNPTRRVR